MAAGASPDVRAIRPLIDRALDHELKGTACVVVDGVSGSTHHIALPDLDAAGAGFRDLRWKAKLTKASVAALTALSQHQGFHVRNGVHNVTPETVWFWMPPSGPRPGVC